MATQTLSSAPAPARDDIAEQAADAIVALLLQREEH